MNERKLNQLFAAARNAAAPAPSENFESRVLREIRRAPAAEAVSVFDELNRLFPKLAFAAVAVIAICVACEFALTLPGLADGVAQLSDQWLFAAN